MWGLSSINPASALNNLINKPETTLLQVLEEPSLSSAIRSPSPNFVKFIMGRINEIFEWVLKDVHSDYPGYIKAQRNALTILASNSSNLQNLYVKSPEYMNNLIDFMKQTDFSPRQCGNFGKIVEMLSHSQNNGYEFLQSLPDLPKFLVTHLSNLGLNELFVNLTLDRDIFKNQSNNEITLLAVQACGGKDGAFGVLAISSLLKQKHDVFQLFYYPEIFTAFLESALNPETPILAVSGIFGIIIRIIEYHKSSISKKSMIKSQMDDSDNEDSSSPSPESVLISYLPKFDLPNRPYDIATPNMIIAFNYLDSALIDYFFEHFHQSTLAAAIQKIITAMPPDRLVTLLNETHLPSRILDQVKPIFPTDNSQTILQNTSSVFKISGQILDITKFLFELDFDNCEDITILKQGLNLLPLDQRISQRKIEYGGPHHQPRNPDSEEDEEEEDDDDCNKVEEFKEPGDYSILNSDEEESDSDSSGDDDAWLQQDDDDSSDDSLDSDNSPRSDQSPIGNFGSDNDSSDEEEKTNFRVPPPPIIQNDDSSEEDIDDKHASNIPPLADSDEESPEANEVAPFVPQNE